MNPLPPPVLDSNMGGIPCEICPRCGALVHLPAAEIHRDWHEAQDRIRRQAAESYYATARIK